MASRALIAFLAFLASCTTARSPDPVTEGFDLPIRSGIPEPDPDAPPPPEVTLLRFRLYADDQLLSAPRLAVRDGEQAEITVQSEAHYVAGFEVEHAPDAWIADPVVESVPSGLVIGATVRSGAGVDLSWSLEWSDTPTPFREREVRFGDGTGTGTVQLPTSLESTAEERTRLPCGQETLLARIPVMNKGEPGALRVTVCAERGRALPPPDAAGRVLEFSLVETREDLEPGPRYSSVEAAKLELASMGPRVLRSFSVRVDPGRPAKLSARTARAYLHDYEIEVGDTVIGTPSVRVVKTGFFAELEERDGEPVLSWTVSSLAGMPPVSSLVPGFGTVEIDRPDVVLQSGRLPLRGALSMAPIARLGGGRPLILFARMLDD